MSLENVPKNHVGAFSAITTSDGVDIATKEVLGKTIYENMQLFEAFMIRNSMTQSGEMKGATTPNVNINTLSSNNPWGTFRTLVKPKVEPGEWVPKKKLTEVTYETFGGDEVKLEINRALKTPTEAIYLQPDKNWLMSDIENAVTQMVINGIITDINFETYKLFPEAAKLYIDPRLGKSPYSFGNFNGETKDEYTDDLIERLARYQSTPDDRYKYFFGMGEVVTIIGPNGHARLLQSKLLIFDGSSFGLEGNFYTGFPYTHNFAGYKMVKSAFLNFGTIGTDEEVVDIQTTIGRFGALLFELGHFQATADIIPDSGKAVGIYATSIWGANIPTIFRSYVQVKYAGTFTPLWGVADLFNNKIVSTSVDEITFEYEVDGVGADGIDYRRTEEDAEASTGTWIEGTPSPITIDSLNSNTKYRIEIRATIGGTGNPVTDPYIDPDTKNPAELATILYGRTK